ncbi:MAG: hypothetical protein K2X93_06790 [Candidatus Obscuribacterales bacterium]|nr:hypothetical protein [Candidatus Obscuribacterales bacterium]
MGNLEKPDSGYTVFRRKENGMYELAQFTRYGLDGDCNLIYLTPLELGALGLDSIERGSERRVNMCKDSLDEWLDEEDSLAVLTARRLCEKYGENLEEWIDKTWQEYKAARSTIE